jgi:hypothetical protein
MKMTILATMLVLCLTGPALAQSDQTEAKDVAGTVDETVEIQKQTQQQQEEWATERAELLARYSEAKASVQYLSERVALETDKSVALTERITELNRRLAESERLTDSVQDTMSAVLARLEDWVARDLPFLPKERGGRLASLREEIARPDVPSAEKLRRLLETMQVEANYGSTLEVYQDQIEIRGEPLFVDILRLGRLSLFWRTSDGKRVGEYDQASGRWVELSGKYDRNIMLAMEMASRMRPVELIDLPVGRIAP